MLIGRQAAKEKLNDKLLSKQAELVVVLGRRRVGKTFLVRQHLGKEIVFQFTGLYQSKLPEQLARFSLAVGKAMNLSVNLAEPKSWFEAFDLLQSYIEGIKSKKKKVIFLDEFPWMATNKSRFLTAFTDFWNTYASQRSDLMVIICGSAASWMINKVLKNKGGLHNRVTERIFLEPFSLQETKLMLMNKNVLASDMDIVKLYMALGGIPFYLDQLKMGESIVQAIDRICFEKLALLRLEYDELLSSLFDNSEKHKLIIETLNQSPAGLNRNELLQKTELNTGGGLSTILEELEASSFIASQVPFGKKTKDKIYKLKDYYISFYLKYIKNSQSGSTGIWNKLSFSSSYRSWSGLAFENVCFDHIFAIQKKLKIEGISSQVSAWKFYGNEEIPGTQIDLLIDRADGVINICEIKFSDSPFVINKEYDQKIRIKLMVFERVTNTKKVLYPTMITTFGVARNQYSQNFIQQEVLAEDLFL